MSAFPRRITLIRFALAASLATFGLFVQAQETPTLPQLQSLISKGHADQALHELDRLTAVLPHPPASERTRGSALYALDRFGEAEQAFALAMADDPADREAVQLRGLTLFRLGRPADAIPLLEKSHAWTGSTKVDPAYVLALCYIDTRRYDDARHAFAEQYAFPPDSAAAHLLAARMLLRREYVAIAQAEARKALALDPTLPLAHRLLGEIALASASPAEAIAEFEQERQRNPLDGSTYDRLGDALSRAGDYPRAQAMLERALLLEPTSTGPYILLGKVLLRQADPASAAGYLERAERMDPANYMTHSLLAQAYRTMGRTEDARRETDLSAKLQSGPEPKLQTLK